MRITGSKTSSWQGFGSWLPHHFGVVSWGRLNNGEPWHKQYAWEVSITFGFSNRVRRLQLNLGRVVIWVQAGNGFVVRFGGR